MFNFTMQFQKFQGLEAVSLVSVVSLRFCVSLKAFSYYLSIIISIVQ